jgi:hypothetical protein
MTTLTVIERKAGTWSLVLKRPDAPAQLYRSCIPTRHEALRRAQTVASLCGYKVLRGR